MKIEQLVEKALEKYAKHYASQETNEMKFGQGEDLRLNVQVYSAYVNLLASQRTQRLTYVLAFSTLALAILTAFSIFLR